MQWIKVYRSIIDDVEWHSLSGDDAKALIMLWILAGENCGELPALKQLAFRLRRSENDVSKLLSRLSAWLEQDASNLLADGYQDASLDKRREEKNRIEESAATQRKSSSVEKPEEIPEPVWLDFLALRKVRRAPVTSRVLDGIRSEAAKANWTLENALKECVLRGWQSFKADWVTKSTVMVGGKTFTKEAQHMPNMPLGTAACNCAGCVNYRSKNLAST